MLQNTGPLKILVYERNLFFPIRTFLASRSGAFLIKYLSIISVKICLNCLVAAYLKSPVPSAVLSYSYLQQASDCAEPSSHQSE